jgi:hypothetical protein
MHVYIYSIYQYTVYMWMYVCEYTCVYIQYMYTLCMWRYVYVNIQNMCSYICGCTHMYIRVYIYSVHVYRIYIVVSKHYAAVLVCIYTYVYIYTHVYISTYACIYRCK